MKEDKMLFNYIDTDIVGKDFLSIYPIKGEKKMSDMIYRQDAINVTVGVWTLTEDKNVAKICEQLKDLPSVESEIITDLDSIWNKLWEIDIPSPGNCPEYIEHHKQVRSIMKYVSSLISKYAQRIGEENEHTNS